MCLHDGMLKIAGSKAALEEVVEFERCSCNMSAIHVSLDPARFATQNVEIVGLLTFCCLLHARKGLDQRCALLYICVRSPTYRQSEVYPHQGEDTESTPDKSTFLLQIPGTWVQDRRVQETGSDAEDIVCSTSYSYGLVTEPDGGNFGHDAGRSQWRRSQGCSG